MKQVDTCAPGLMEKAPMWNSTCTVYPRDRTVVQLFEEIVSAHPGSIALTFENQQVTYVELNARANRLARRLRELGVGPETMVSCCIERSIELIVALVAILKAGGAYVPLDSAYPKERLKFFLEDTRAKIVLTNKTVPAFLADCSSICQYVDVSEAASSSLADANPSPAVGPTSLAYVMYTSGSTGLPKGVMVENRSIVRLVRNTNFCRFGVDEVFLQFAPISFDASTLEIWGALLNGGRLVIMSPQKASLDDLGRVIREQNVTVLWLTSGLFNLMVEEKLEDLRHVRQLLAGGDVLSSRHVRLALENIPNCRLVNGYGPTENTTFTCCHVMNAGDSIPASVPIGRPISNTQVYILDEQLHPVPPGTVGELYATGDGLARGYLNNSEATQEKFLQDPFVADSNARMYRTGDLARASTDGLIEFLGRVDNQVKIRGHRIEPGEVESALNTHKNIKQSCVLSRTEEKGAKHLVAYYVSSNSTLTATELRKFLAEKLPQHMIPAVFVQVNSLPLTLNGKVDRAALPVTSLAVRNDIVVEATANALEQTILATWREFLSVDPIGPNDNFFDLGGNSLILVNIHTNLQKTLQITLPITALFEFATVKSLARHLSSKLSPESSFSDARQRAQRQRAAFARQRERRLAVPHE
jgi:amino acid adenylation domain-containing protein